MKKALAVLSAICLLLLAGCQAQTSGQQPVSTGTQSAVPGYMGAGETVESENDNAGVLKEIAVEQRNEQMRVCLEFEGGLPQYEVKLLDSPVRVMVKMHLSEDQANGQDPAQLGTYMGLIREEVESEVTYYFQFSGLADMKVNESGNTLEINLVTTGAESETRYYVLMTHNVDAMQLAEDNGMYPVYMNDWSTIRYISAPMLTLEEADVFLDAVNGDIEASGLDIVAEVVVTALGDAPGYEEEISRTDLLSLATLLASSGTVVQPDIWAMDARYLCTLPDRNAALFARPVEYMEDGSLATYEQLWVYQDDGTRELYMEGDFSSIAVAAFSNDGSYLALIDTATGRRTAYLYDIVADELRALSLEGFGDYTSSLCWGDDGKLYAMTGDESIQLLYYDPTQPEGSRIGSVEEREGSFGELAWAQGALFFVGDDGMIYKIDPSTGVRTEFYDAQGFVMSPDGKNMVCMYYAADVETDAQTGISVVSIADGTETVLQNEFALMDASWSADGQTMYYLVLNESDDAYPCSLYRMHMSTGRVERVGSLASTSMMALDGSSILVKAYYDRGGISMPVTYRITLP